MKKEILFLLTVLVLAASLLTACSGNNSASAEETASVVGNWKLVSYGSVSNLTLVAPDVNTSLTFEADGKLHGNVGCNSFNGDYKVDGDKITFGPMMSTRMACQGVIADQESITLAVFIESASFVIDGDTLTITSANDSSVVVLARK